MKQFNNTHLWGNLLLNRIELIDFETTNSLSKKIYIGCSIIAKNHKLIIEYDFLSTYNDMRIKLKNANNMPIISDLKMLCEELNNSFDMNYAEGTTSLYLGKDLYVNFRATGRTDKDFIKMMNEREDY